MGFDGEGFPVELTLLRECGRGDEKEKQRRDEPRSDHRETS
jgi:hypothetical protein